ncbi:hypothetical protein LXL04_039757 [Taraxacum kok-saghyz]
MKFAKEEPALRGIDHDLKPTGNESSLKIQLTAIAQLMKKLALICKKINICGKTDFNHFRIIYNKPNNPGDSYFCVLAIDGLFPAGCTKHAIYLCASVGVCSVSFPCGGYRLTGSWAVGVYLVVREKDTIEKRKKEWISNQPLTVKDLENMFVNS